MNKENDNEDIPKSCEKDNLGEVILRSNSQMVANITECLKLTMNQLGSSMNEQVTKMTGAIKDLKEHMSQETRGTPQAPYSDNSDGDDDEGDHDNADHVSLHGRGDDDDLQNNDEVFSTKNFLGKDPLNLGKEEKENDFLEEFSKSYTGDEKWGEPVDQKLEKVVKLAFEQELDDSIYKKLTEEVSCPSNCKVSSAKKINPVFFGSVSPTIRSNDIKLQQIQHDMSKMTSCFIKLLEELPEIFISNGNKEKLAIKTVINGLKLAGHAGQALNKYRKKNFLASVGDEYKDLSKYAADSDTHLFGDDLGDSLKRPKSTILQEMPLKMGSLIKGNLMIQKTRGRPKSLGRREGTTSTTGDTATTTGDTTATHKRGPGQTAVSPTNSRQTKNSRN